MFVCADVSYTCAGACGRQKKPTDPWSRSQLQAVGNCPKLQVLGTKVLWKSRKSPYPVSHLSSHSAPNSLRNVSKCYCLEISEELQTLLSLSMSYFVTSCVPRPHLYFINYSKEKINKNKKGCTFLEEPDSRRARGHFAACQADIDFQAHTSKCDRWRTFLAPGSSLSLLALSHRAAEGTETARSSTAQQCQWHRVQRRATLTSGEHPCEG